MAHFAEVKDGIVTQVIVANKDFINTLPNANEWFETSYNVRGGVYYDPETNNPIKDQLLIEIEIGRKRKNYAGIGFRYDKELDAFIPPQPYPSWKLDTETCLWNAPIPYPQDGKQYIWNEAEQEWTYTGYYINENNELVKEEV